MTAVSHRFPSLVCVASCLAVLAGCGGTEPTNRAHGSPDVTVPAPPTIVPTLPDVKNVDLDQDHLDDAIVATSPGASVTVHVVLTRPVEAQDLAAFADAGGTVDYVFRALSYGFLGTIPSDRIASLPAAIGGGLHLVTVPRAVVRDGDLETRSSRARAAWPATVGSASSPIAIFDTGIDPTHPDLAGRQVFWKDYSSDAHPTAIDLSGHGTHVAGLALGSGAAFEATADQALEISETGTLAGKPAGVAGGTTIWSRDAVVLGASGTYLGANPAVLRVFAVDALGAETMPGQIYGPSPLTVTGLSIPAASMIGLRLVPTVHPDMTTYALAGRLVGYGATDDGFPVMNGVAPGARWYGAKIFNDDGSSDGVCVFIALDELLVNHEALGVKVANLSISSDNPEFPAAVATMADHGIVVVASAGNTGPNGPILPLGMSARAITVGSADFRHHLTDYTSIGLPTPAADQDMKPDLVAPGGGGHRSRSRRTRTRPIRARRPTSRRTTTSASSARRWRLPSSRARRRC